MNNKYSFCNVKKSDVLDVKEDNESNTNNICDDEEYENITIYGLNQKIFESYCTDNGNISLFRDNNDDSLATLYEEQEYEDIKAIYIYKPDGIYVATKSSKEENQIIDVFYMNSVSFVNMCHMINNRGPKIKLHSYVKQNSTLVMKDKKILSYEDHSEFQKDYIRYSMSSQYIVIYSILDNITSIINSYIVTR